MIKAIVWVTAADFAVVQYATHDYGVIESDPESLNAGDELLGSDLRTCGPVYALLNSAARVDVYLHAVGLARDDAILQMQHLRRKRRM